MFTREALSDVLEEALQSYRCYGTIDDEGNGLPLVDMLTPPGETTVEQGEAELSLLCEHLLWAIMSQLDRVSAEVNPS